MKTDEILIILNTRHLIVYVTTNFRIDAINYPSGGIIDMGFIGLIYYKWKY